MDFYQIKYLNQSFNIKKEGRHHLTAVAHLRAVVVLVQELVSVADRLRWSNKSTGSL